MPAQPKHEFSFKIMNVARLINDPADGPDMVAAPGHSGR
jgi:hypothetical protein